MKQKQNIMAAQGMARRGSRNKTIIILITLTIYIYCCKRQLHNMHCALCNVYCLVKLELQIGPTVKRLEICSIK